MENQDQEWLDYVKKNGKARCYAHFDPRTSLGQESVQEYVTNPANIAKHGFFPFIQYYKVEKKVRKVQGKLVPKVKRRLISYSAHMDSCIHQRYAFLINRAYNAACKEKGLDGISVAYRNNLHKEPFQLAAEAFSFIEQNQPCFIMVGDFTEFFDHIDHQYLKQQLCRLLQVETLTEDYYRVFKSVTKYGFCSRDDILKAKGIEKLTYKALRELNHAGKLFNKEELKAFKPFMHKHKASKGIPQGSPLSAVLANVYMLAYDQEMKAFVESYGGKYMRYSDDTIMILPLTEGRTVDDYWGRFQELLSHYEGMVELQSEKTRRFEYRAGELIPISENTPSFMDYLGLRFQSDGIRIRPKCFSKYHYRMKRKARNNRRQQIARAKKQKARSMVSNRRLYELYGKESGRVKGEPLRNLLTYLTRVQRSLHLEDPEMQALLKGGAKRKIRRELNKLKATGPSKHSED